jgi:hypothetical protein
MSYDRRRMHRRTHRNVRLRGRKQTYTAYKRHDLTDNVAMMTAQHVDLEEGPGVCLLAAARQKAVEPLVRTEQPEQNKDKHGRSVSLPCWMENGLKGGGAWRAPEDHIVHADIGDFSLGEPVKLSERSISRWYLFHKGEPYITKVYGFVRSTKFLDKHRPWAHKAEE